MRYSIEKQPANSVLHCTLEDGEKLTAEGGSMVAMHAGIAMETSTSNVKGSGGGLMKGLKRMVSGESFFMNHYQASKDGQDIYLSPRLNGDINHYALDNSSLLIQGHSYLAHTGQVELDTSFQGIKNLFSGESFFWINANGTGEVFFNAFGAIYEIDVTREVLIDTGHVVAFEPSLNYELTKVGSSWITSMLGGEGIVLRFSGKGKVWCQSHNATQFGYTLGPLLRPR